MPTDDLHCDVCGKDMDASTRFTSRCLIDTGINSSMCCRCSIVFDNEVWKNLKENPRYRELMREVMEEIGGGQEIHKLDRDTVAIYIQRIEA
jgi:predicted amidophosphoribosyltransferase